MGARKAFCPLALEAKNKILLLRFVVDFATHTSYTHIHTHRQTHTQTDSETDRQTDRHIIC